VKRLRAAFVVVLLLGGTRLLAQDPLLLEPLDEVDLVCKLGGESDSADGSLGEARLYWRPSLDSLISGGYVYSTLTATNAPHTNTRIASLLGEYSFGSFGLGGGYDRIVESDLLASNTFTLRPFFESGAWRVEVNGSRRKTDFDRFGFVNVPLYRPAGTIYVSGSAKLNLTSTGFGGALDYMGKTWHAYASYDSYSYRDFEGETTVSAIRDANGRVSAQVFNALAGRMVDRLQRFAGSRATQKAGLLDYAATVGLDVALSPFGFGLEAGRDKDHLSDNVSDSLTGILSLDATRRMTLELRGGATRSDILGTIRFIGLSLVFRSIPKVKA
jgi:hypothetical protein